MFNLNEWLRTALSNGVCKGQLSLAFAQIKAADYLLKGVLSQEDIEYFDQNAIEPVTEEMEEEITEEEPSA